MIDRVTITGADDTVNPLHLADISAKFPFVEWGILFSHSRRLQAHPRYPSLDWVVQLQEVAARNPHMKLSAHLCGGWVRGAVVGGENHWADYYSRHIARTFSRVQLNLHGEPTTPKGTFVEDMIEEHPDTAFILQCDGVNDEWVKAIVNRRPDLIAPLFDQSHGGGRTPDEWPAPWPGVYNGYAGGLGPSNIETEFENIERRSGRELAWIDMESKMRSPDDQAFALKKAKAVLHVCGKRFERRGPVADAARSSFSHDLR
jgi:hypothetical protein